MSPSPLHRQVPRARVLLSWSSGKDSAWALHVLRQQPGLEVVGLLTTLNEAVGRVAMHGVPERLLDAQAEAAGHSPGDGHSPQLGWALDGFPVYGPYGPGGRRMAHAEQGCAGPLCLDECGGLPMELQLV